MVKVYKQTAGKDYPAQGIKKGDTYYRWTPGFRGRELKSLTYPKPSQQTANPFLQTVLGAEERLEAVTSPDELREIAEEVRGAGEEAQGSFDNMPEGLQQGETGQLLEQRASSAEEWASELEDIADCWQEKLDLIENPDTDDGEGPEDPEASENEAREEAISEAQQNIPDWG